MLIKQYHYGDIYFSQVDLAYDTLIEKPWILQVRES